MLQVQVQSRDSCNTVTEREKVMVFIRQRPVDAGTAALVFHGGSGVTIVYAVL